MLGAYFDSKTSQRHECTLYLDENQSVVLEGIDVPPVPLSTVSFSPRIGDTARFITFPDDSVFETLDNDAVDALLLSNTTNHFGFLIYYWERSKKLILLSTLSLVGVTFLLLAFGIPLMSRYLAQSLPTSVSSKLAENVLETLDERVLSPTQLPEQRQQDLSTQFKRLTAGLEEFQLKLYFRKGNEVGANAFALPDGTVVMTDELVALADNDLELQAVLLHEIGHVVNRHSLRQLIENSSSTLVLIWLTGDIEAGSSWFVTLPTVLLHSSYSRDNEWEADGYALERMRQANISPHYFASLMKKLSATLTATEVAQKNNSDNRIMIDHDKNNPKDYKRKNENSWFDYISSHPPTASRIKRFEEAALI